MRSAPTSIKLTASTRPLTPPEEASMKSVMLWALAGLNVLLAAVVINRYVPAQTAHAQVGGGVRPSDYVMVPGELNGVSTGVVFIIDTSKGELSAMSYDD